METTSIFAVFTFNVFIFMSSLNVANSEEDNNDAIVSVSSIVDAILATSVFVIVVAGIVLCGFCSKYKGNGPDSYEEESSSPRYDTFGCNDCSVVNGDATGVNVFPDSSQDADIYDCVNETTGTRSPFTDPYDQSSSSADDDTIDDTEMVYNIAYQSIDSANTEYNEDYDIYDKVTPNCGEDMIGFNEGSRILHRTKKPVRKSLSDPINSTLLSCSGEHSEQDVNTTSADDETIQRRPLVPTNITSVTKKKLGKAKTLQFGSSMRTPLDSLPEEDYDAVGCTGEVNENDSDKSNQSLAVKEKSNTLHPNIMRLGNNNALLYELTKVQKMRKEVAQKRGGTLPPLRIPPLRNQSEYSTDDEDKPSVTDRKIIQENETGDVTDMFHSNNDDVASLQSVSSCSDKSDFSTDSSLESGDECNPEDNKQLDPDDPDTLDSVEEHSDSNFEDSIHTYVNVDPSADVDREVLTEEEESDDTATYGNLGANRDFVFEETLETDLMLTNQVPDTSLGKAVVDRDTSDEEYASFRYEDVKVDLRRRSTKVRKATVINEEVDTGEDDDIFYPDQDRTEDNVKFSTAVTEHGKLDTQATSIGNYDDPSQRRPHKIFTNESFLRIQEAIAMQQAVNNNPANKVPVFCRRMRVQRFSL